MLLGPARRRLPGSLRNIYQELQDDLGIKPVKHGYLASWAKQGVLMLNACLTVRAEQPNSHAGKGWEKFTDAAIRAVNDLKRPVVFLLWGAYAQKKIKLIDEDGTSSSSRRTRRRCRPPTGSSAASRSRRCNAALEEAGEKPIDWRLPEIASEDES